MSNFFYFFFIASIEIDMPRSRFVFNALFGIVTAKIDCKTAVYSALIRVLTIGSDRRYPMFKSVVVNQYIVV